MFLNSLHLGGRFLHEIKSSPFIRHNAIFFAGSLGVATLNYLLYPVLGRVLAPADFGEVQTLITLFAQAAVVLNVLAYMTIHITVNTRDPTERNRTLLGLEYSILVASAAVLVVSLFFMQDLQSFLHFSSVWPFIALLVAFYLSLPLVMRMAYLRGRKLFTKSSLTDGIGSAAKLIVSPILAIVGFKSFGAIAGLAISQVIALFFGLRWARAAGFGSIGIRRTNFQFRRLKPQLRHAVAILLVSFSITTLMSLDMLAIKHYFSPDQAGLYAGVTTTARIIFFLTAPFAGVLLTMVSLNQSMRKNLLQLKGSLALVLIMGGIGVVVMNLAYDLVIKIFVGQKYMFYSSYLPDLGVIMLLLAVANMLLLYQIALKRYIFVWSPTAVTFLTIILLYLRHNSVGQVIYTIQVACAALVIIVTGQYVIETKLKRSAGGNTAVNFNNRSNL
jgi:O-antigen/teichoic acid export membrane protein